MPDMLVKLYTLPDVVPLITRLKASGIDVRRAGPWEKRTIADWIRTQFGTDWAEECGVALENRPVSCYIAVEKDRSHVPGADPYDRPIQHLVGFACYDVISRGMFGPTGVQETYRGQGIGKALLLTCLYSMATEGYAYAIIAQVGPVDFYARAVGATLIEGSEPGVARERLMG